MARARSSLAATDTCREHRDAPAVQRCQSCGRRLCDECFRFLVDRRPACARCAYEASTRPQRRVSLAVVFLSVAAGLWIWLARRFALYPDQLGLLVCGGLATVVVAGLLGASARHGARASVEGRDRDDYEPTDDRAHPYRAGARRVLLAVSPRISGKATALVVLASLLTAAMLVPAALRLPRWVVSEIVIGSWWAIVAATLSVLLFRGFRLRDDFVYFAPWDRPAPPSEGAPVVPSPPRAKSSFTIGDLGAVDGEGCLFVLAIAVVLGGAFGAAWVVVEIALPLVFFVLYTALMHAIRRAADDRRGCEGDLLRSAMWGAIWATIYVVPLGAITWLVHALHR